MTGRESSRSVGTWDKLAAEVVILLGTVFILALCGSAQADEARGRMSPQATTMPLLCSVRL